MNVRHLASPLVKLAVVLQIRHVKTQKNKSLEIYEMLPAMAAFFLDTRIVKKRRGENDYDASVQTERI